MNRRTIRRQFDSALEIRDSLVIVPRAQGVEGFLQRSVSAIGCLGEGASSK
jgi:hypothetical protein